MCGISGIIGWPAQSGEGVSTIKKMINSLHHRGPDDNGTWIDHTNKIYLGHNRLSILDLSKNGYQPMVSKCSRYIMTFNGEIYNHLSIRTLIKKEKNIYWYGTSDTETLVEAIACFGLKKTLKLIRGMYSFCFFDKKEKSVYLVRDLHGEKPLYFLNLNNKYFSFASEINAFYHIRDFKPEINQEALSCFFKRGWIAAPLAIWKNVSKIMPGTFVKLKKNQQGKFYVESLNKYWDCANISIKNQQNPYKKTFEKSTLDLEDLLLEVLDGQSLSDVPLGVFLSGGVDSSLIAALMQKTSGKKIKTFSIGFSDKNYDESNFAGRVASHINTDHLKLEARPKDALNLIEKMPFVYSEPFADSSQIPTTLLCGLVREHVKVALSGDGGDELFTGYNRYLFAHNYFKILNKYPRKLRQTFVYILNMTSPKLINQIGSLVNFKRLGDKLHKASEIIPMENLQDFYEALTTYWSDNTIIGNAKTNTINFTHQLGDIENMMLADQLNYLPNDILVKGDRASMSFGLETRAPFLDRKVTEFAWSLPTNYRLNNNNGKRILKEILYKYVPKNLVDRPKQGFGMPVNEWLRGPLRDWAEDLLSKSKLPDEDLLNGYLVRKTWDEHISGTRNWEYKLWPVLMWQQWKFCIKDFRK